MGKVTSGGYFGQALVVDVDGRSATGAPLSLHESVLRAYLGGVGLGTWLLHRLAPPGVDPTRTRGTAGVRVLAAWSARRSRRVQSSPSLPSPR